MRARYIAKTLFDGAVIGKVGKFVAVPDKGYKNEKDFIVEFGEQIMFIKSWHKAAAFRKFHDNFGGADYTLGYFEWKPYVNTNADRDVAIGHESRVKLSEIWKDVVKKKGIKVKV